MFCCCMSAEENVPSAVVAEQLATSEPPAAEEKIVLEEPVPAEPIKEEPSPVVEEQPPAVDQENKAPVENIPVQGSVAIEFDDDKGQARTFKVVKKPLGVVFDVKTKPLTVDFVRASSHGEELGIQKGWALKSVSNDSSREDVSKKDHADVMAILQSYVAPLPNDSKSVNFNLCFSSNGKDQIVTVSRKPLGMEFENVTPVTVRGVTSRSHSEQLGIGVGWVLKKVGDEDVSNLSCVEALDVLAGRVGDLPANEK